MMREKNRLMLWVAAGVVLLSLVFHVLGRVYHTFDYEQHMEHMVTSIALERYMGGVLHVLLAVPVVLFAAGLVLYRLKPDHRLLPLLVSLVLATGSISMIGGAGGRVELHFSLFMVVTMLAYYERVSLIALTTLLFAAQLLIGYLYAPELVFGASQYSWVMLSVELLFLLVTAAASTWQIMSGRKIRRALEEAQQGQRRRVVEEVLASISATSQQLLDTARTLAERVEETAGAANEIRAAIQQVAAGADTQVETAEQNARVVSDMVRDIEVIAATSTQIAHVSQASAEAAEAGNESVAKLLDQMNRIHASVNDSHAAISTLHERSQAIGQFLDVIAGIAEQTNLLALNAAIEAARAGEAGRGFTVVADEVRKLAEQSAQSAGQIAELVQGILEDTFRSVEMMNTVQDNVSRGLDVAGEAKESFAQIVRSARQVSEQVNQITGVIQELLAGSEQVSRSVSDMAAIAQESSHSMNHVAAASEGQQKSLDVVAQASGMLRRLTRELDEAMNKMKESEG